MNDTLFDKALVKVKLLSTIFRTNENRYLSPACQEAEVRKDFLDKFFAALGWDVNHDEQTDPYGRFGKIAPQALSPSAIALASAKLGRRDDGWRSRAGNPVTDSGGSFGFN